MNDVETFLAHAIALEREAARRYEELAAAPDGTGPETAGWEGVDAQMHVDDALRLALEGERRGHACYAAIAATARDPETVRLARAFAEEEAEHVIELQKLVAARAAA